jgi:hypothetical protein
MSSQSNVIDRKTVPAFSGEGYATLYAEQTALIPVAGDQTKYARVSVYYESNPADNGSRVRIYLLNRDLDWKELDSYGIELMSLMRESRKRVKDKYVAEQPTVAREPADVERQVFATLDEELRSHIIKLPNIGKITCHTERDPVHTALNADFEAAWGFVTRLIGL